MITDREILKDRFEATKKQLEARLAKLKLDARSGAASARDGAANEADRLRAKLEELGKAIKNGWHSMTEDAAAAVNRMMDRHEEAEEERDD